MKVFHLMRSSLLVLERFTLNSARGRCSQLATFSDDISNPQHLESAKTFVESDEPKEYFSRRLPLTVEEYETRKALPPVQPENPHLLKVAVVGEPNVGKSTLINSLVKWKICAVSKKVHTTRKKSSAMLVEGNKQIVFLDTPGFVTPEHSKRHKLEVSLVTDPKRSATSADLIAVVIDASNKWSNKEISPHILQMLENLSDKTSVLVLNKVDLIKSKKELLRITRILTEQTALKKKESFSAEDVHLLEHNMLALGQEKPKIENTFPPKIFPDSTKATVRVGWPYFSHVFMISALHSDGVDQLREFMFSIAKPAPWMYHPSNITDQHPHLIVKQIVREKLLDYLPKEIPYGLTVKITSWILDPAGVLRIMIAIGCPNSRHKKFVIGPSGSQISNCVHSSRQAIADAFRCEVMLKIEVK